MSMRPESTACTASRSAAEPLAQARARHAASLAELPVTARQLSRGEPAIPTVFEQ